MKKRLSVLLLIAALFANDFVFAMMRGEESEGGPDDVRKSETPVKVVRVEGSVESQESDPTHSEPTSPKTSESSQAADAAELAEIGRKLLETGYFVCALDVPLFTKKEQEKEDTADTEGESAGKGDTASPTPRKFIPGNLILRPCPKAEFTREVGAESGEFTGLIEKLTSSASEKDAATIQRSLKSMKNIKAQVIHVEPYPDGLDPFVRFSLNCVFGIPPGEFPAAILVPARSLLPYVVHLSPYTTAVWKPDLDLRELEGAVLMLPKGAPESEGLDLGKLALQRYEGKLKDAVESFIDETTGYRLSVTPNFEERNPFLLTAMLGGVNVNHPDVFADVLRERPYMSFGMEASPHRVGIGSWMHTLSMFVDEFNKLYKIGKFKGQSHAEPRFAKKCQIEPLMKLVETAGLQLFHLLNAAENKDWLKDFREVQYPKVSNALVNFREYIKHIQDPSRKGKWKLRLYPAEIPLRLSSAPYEVAKMVLEAECSRQVQEEATLLYWFSRYLEGFHGVGQDDRKTHLDRLRSAAKGVQEKMVGRKSISWFYAQLLNNVLNLLNQNREKEGFIEFFREGLDILKPILPKRGEFQYGTPSDRPGVIQTGTVQFAETLEKYGLKLPDDYFNEGINLPPLFSPYGVGESML